MMREALFFVLFCTLLHLVGGEGAAGETTSGSVWWTWYEPDTDCEGTPQHLEWTRSSECISSALLPLDDPLRRASVHLLGSPYDVAVSCYDPTSETNYNPNDDFVIIQFFATSNAQCDTVRHTLLLKEPSECSKNVSLAIIGDDPDNTSVPITYYDTAFEASKHIREIEGYVADVVLKDARFFCSRCNWMFFKEAAPPYFLQGAGIVVFLLVCILLNYSLQDKVDKWVKTLPSKLCCGAKREADEVGALVEVLPSIVEPPRSGHEAMAASGASCSEAWERCYSTVTPATPAREHLATPLLRNLSGVPSESMGSSLFSLIRSPTAATSATTRVASSGAAGGTPPLASPPHGPAERAGHSLVRSSAALRAACRGTAMAPPVLGSGWRGGCGVGGGFGGSCGGGGGCSQNEPKMCSESSLGRRNSAHTSLLTPAPTSTPLPQSRKMQEGDDDLSPHIGLLCITSPTADPLHTLTHAEVGLQLSPDMNPTVSTPLRARTTGFPQGSFSLPKTYSEKNLGDNGKAAKRVSLLTPCTPLLSDPASSPLPFTQMLSSLAPAVPVEAQRSASFSPATVRLPELTSPALSVHPLTPMLGLHTSLRVPSCFDLEDTVAAPGRLYAPPPDVVTSYHEHSAPSDQMDSPYTLYSPTGQSSLLASPTSEEQGSGCDEVRGPRVVTLPEDTASCRDKASLEGFAMKGLLGQYAEILEISVDAKGHRAQCHFQEPLVWVRHSEVLEQNREVHTPQSFRGIRHSMQFGAESPLGGASPKGVRANPLTVSFPEQESEFPSDMLSLLRHDAENVEGEEEGDVVVPAKLYHATPEFLASLPRVESPEDCAFFDEKFANDAIVLKTVAGWSILQLPSSVVWLLHKDLNAVSTCGARYVRVVGKAEFKSKCSPWHEWWGDFELCVGKVERVEAVNGVVNCVVAFKGSATLTIPATCLTRCSQAEHDRDFFLSPQKVTHRTMMAVFVASAPILLALKGAFLLYFFFHSVNESLMDGHGGRATNHSLWLSYSEVYFKLFNSGYPTLMADCGSVAVYFFSVFHPSLGQFVTGVGVPILALLTISLFISLPGVLTHALPMIVLYSWLWVPFFFVVVVVMRFVRDKFQPAVPQVQEARLYDMRYFKKHHKKYLILSGLFYLSFRVAMELIAVIFLQTNFNYGVLLYGGKPYFATIVEEFQMRQATCLWELGVRAISFFV